MIRLLERIFVPNHSRNSLILFKLNTLYSCKECIRAIWSKWYNPLNWTYLYNADVFHQLRVLIRLLERIFVPNHSRNSLSLFKLNTLYSCKECIRANWGKWYNSLNWTYLYDADVFHQFRVLIRLLERISFPNHSRDSLDIYLYNADVFHQLRVLIRLLERIFVPNHSRNSLSLFKLNTLYSCKECIRANWGKWYNSLNWTYLYDADVFHQFWVLIRLLERISFPNHSRDSKLYSY